MRIVKSGVQVARIRCSCHSERLPTVGRPRLNLTPEQMVSAIGISDPNLLSRRGDRGSYQHEKHQLIHGRDEWARKARSLLRRVSGPEIS